MFSKILIANRGEITVRIIRACKEMGISTVAVYSDADKDALHVALADESFCIGKADASDSYLNKERIISTALVSGAQAIHPGYGFLSENSDFAEMCQKNNIVFIGPTIENMKLLSDKEQIKRLMSKAGLPTIPGSTILDTMDSARSAAEKIGYPIMLKARSGGGGRGIRLVNTQKELESAYLSSVSESKAAFGDGAVYMEKYINPARHIEVQVLADESGNAVCLGERDCSIQIKNQKLIEESPSPAINSNIRNRVMKKITKAVKELKYVGVGTLEFLLDEAQNLYFMEMNIRLQVEHTVTESVTGIDLVKWQIRTSAGIPLDFEQNDICFRGASIECRINAKSTGKVEFLHVPGGPFVRFDTFLMTGMNITPHYDSLLGKLIVYEATREKALRKMKSALCELVIEGVPNNINEQLEVINSDRFMSGNYNLNFFVK